MAMQNSISWISLASPGENVLNVQPKQHKNAGSLETY